MDKYSVYSSQTVPGSGVKYVCVIGAGCSGLVSIKCCLENGLNPVCYEIGADVGGIWHQAERIRLQQKPTMYSSLICNSSKVNQGYSDFPYPKEWPPYLPWKKVVDYFNMYADHFDLRRYIKFNTKVVRVYKSANYTVTGSWMVETVNMLTDENDVIEYDAVIAGTGKHSKLMYPDIPGLEQYFQGRYCHGCEYVSCEGLEGKSVVIVGAASSGSDISVGASTVAKKVMLCVGKGVWIFPRIYTNGLPLDMCSSTRFNNNISAWLPSVVNDWRAQKVVNTLKSRFHYVATGLEPKDLPTNLLAPKTINDELQFKIYTGRILLRPAIKLITPAGKVRFTNGEEDSADVIIAATGYDPEYPYLPKEVFPNFENAKLYRWIFPYELEHPETLTILGLYPAEGGAGCSQIELQARYVTGVLSGRYQLPKRSVMQKRRKKTHDCMTLNGKLIFKRGLYEYQEELAYELGLVPSFFKLLFTDPQLFNKVYFGPIIPVHYRLIGDHRWEGARTHALNVWKDCLSGIRSEKFLKQMKNRKSAGFQTFVIFLLVFFLAVYISFVYSLVSVAL